MGNSYMPNTTQTIKQKILNIPQIVKKNSNILIKMLPALSFIIPFLMLYYMYPSSFEATWKGRTYYLFFIWLVFLELILSWEKIQIKIHRLKSARFIIFSILLMLPTAYVITANFLGLNTAIVDISPKHYYPGVDDPLFWAKLMPLSIEYLVFAVLFALIILVAHGIRGLKDFSLPPCLIGIIGLVYVIDNLYPFGEFTPFQIVVPAAATLAANVLNLMGYQTEWIGQSYGTPVLSVKDPKGGFPAEAGISWSCSGVDSFIIYSVVILLFLKNSDISWRQKIAYFTIGAVVTYFINILRIVTIFMIGINYGMRSPRVTQFHDYYGALYSITWIAAYPLVIIGTRALWGKIRKV
jgi:exosortase/archaeosortase family protein